MLWLRENWFWLAVSVAFVWMHMRMHGGHGGAGGHGKHGQHHQPNSTREDPDHAEH